jgi:superfamily II DNA/RNA helicase
MDLSRFIIDPALFAGAEASSAYRSVFFEKLLSSLFEHRENLFVRSDIQRDRAEIFAFPALYWLGYPEKARDCAKALYLCIDDQAAAVAFQAAKRLASGLGANAPALLDAATGGAGAKDAPLLFASVNAFHDLIASDALSPREYGFVIVDQADQVAELPGEFVRKIQGALMPSWERKTLVISAKTTPKAKNFAWDFADNPKELKLAETMGLASTTSTQSVKLEDADKIRYLLKLLEERGDRHLCVFCNLKSTAAELSARLDMNGVATDYIGGNLNPDRKNQIVAKALSWTGKRREPLAEDTAAEDTAAEDTAAETGAADGEPAEAPAVVEAAAVPAPEAAASRFAKGSFVLVLTDDGAKGLAKPEFVTVVNYDIPLEPEFYFERLIFLKRQDPDALLFNLVCDRYMYGIPAIEHTIDAPLPLATPDTSAFPEDLSAGRPIELPEPRMRGRDGRHGRDGYRQDDRRGRDGYRRDDRTDRTDRTRDDRPARERFASDDRQAPAPRDSARRDDRRSDDRRGRDNSGRRGDSRRPAERQAAQGGQGSGPGPDPYALSMEERLALYKRKYGRNVEGARPAGARAEGGNRDGQRRRDGRDGNAGKGRPRGEPGSRQRRQAEGGAEKREAAPREKAPRDVHETNAGRDGFRQAPAPAAPQVPSASPDIQADETSRPKGFLGKLQDLFGQRKD